MFKKCIKCDRLWQICGGPNFSIMPPPAILEWIKAYVAYKGYTHQEISDARGMPKGTIDRILAKSIDDVTDFKYDSIRLLIASLMWLAGYHDDVESLLPCPDPDGKAAEIEDLLVEAENKCETAKKEALQYKEQLQLQAEKFEHHKNEIIARYELDRKEYKEDTVAKINHLKDQCNRLRRTAVIMTALLLIVLFSIIAFLIYDILHPDIGYFKY